jgi:hypothetical protein
MSTPFQVPPSPGATKGEPGPRQASRRQAGRRGRPRVHLRLEELERRALPSFGGTPYQVGLTITPTSTVPEAEGHIAVDPSDFQNLLVACQDKGTARLGGHPTLSKYAFSSDNGATWADRNVPVDPATGLLLTSDGGRWLFSGDDVVAIDKAGNAYHASLYVNPGAENGVYVGVTTVKSLERLGKDPDAGFTAGQIYPVFTNLDPNTKNHEDKEWLAVDNSDSPYSGNVYVAWRHFGGGTADGIVFSRSTDHGRTWSAPLAIDHGGDVHGAQVEVGPSGEVYVVYVSHLFENKASLFLAKSTDGGVTFSDPVAITPRFDTLQFDATYPKHSLPALAVSPTNGNVYVVYADEPNQTAGAEVEFISSTDGGATFSAPVVINDTPIGQQFMPAVTVDAQGVIHASWFDTRHSPSDSSVYDIYATFSTDGGLTFRPNARVTASINVGASPFIGDYSGIAAGGGFAHPLWTTGYTPVPGSSFTGGLQTATLTTTDGSTLLAAAVGYNHPRAALATLQADSLLAEALTRWQASGADTSGLSVIDVRIADLSETTLGLACGNTIWLDDNAAGWGWFVDPTPWDDSELTPSGNPGEQNRMDLLTVLDRESGHLLA